MSTTAGPTSHTSRYSHLRQTLLHLQRHEFLVLFTGSGEDVCTGQWPQPLAAAQVSTGEVTQIGETRLYTSFCPSPDAKYVLVAWLERPFSYTVPCGRFPKRVQLWDRRVPSHTKRAGLVLSRAVQLSSNFRLVYVEFLQ